MITGMLHGIGSLTGALSNVGALSGSLSVPTGAAYPSYEGSYEADALFSEQTFPTSEKVMHDDFTVHAINYTEAPNPYGITVTIGG